MSWNANAGTTLKLCLAACLLVIAASRLSAAEEPVFEIEMRDGAILPSRLEVPAKTRFKVVIKNTGTVPAEFESRELRKETIVPAGGTAAMIIRTLDPGEYQFFDDFQPSAPPAVLVAK